LWNVADPSHPRPSPWSNISTICHTDLLSLGARLLPTATM